MKPARVKISAVTPAPGAKRKKPPRMMPSTPMTVSAHQVLTPIRRMKKDMVSARKLKKMIANPVSTVTMEANSIGVKKMSAPRRMSRTARVTMLPVRPPCGAKTREEMAMTASQQAKIRTTTSAEVPGQTIISAPITRAMTPLTMTVLPVRLRSMYPA